MENIELEFRGDTEKFNPEGMDLKYQEFSQYNYYGKYNAGNDKNRNGINDIYDNEVLTLVLQKREAVKPKKIASNVK